MAKPIYIANTTVFDGRRLRRKHGVLFDDGGIRWMGAHARAPKDARQARDVDGAGRTLLPGLIDTHVHLQFDGGSDFEKE